MNWNTSYLTNLSSHALINLTQLQWHFSRSCLLTSSSLYFLQRLIIKYGISTEGISHCKPIFFLNFWSTWNLFSPVRITTELIPGLFNCIETSILLALHFKHLAKQDQCINAIAISIPVKRGVSGQKPDKVTYMTRQTDRKLVMIWWK